MIINEANVNVMIVNRVNGLRSVTNRLYSRNRTDTVNNGLNCQSHGNAVD